MIKNTVYYILKPRKLNYHGLPFAFHDYRDIISASPGLDYEKKRNGSQSATGITKPGLFYIDAYYNFAKSSWYTG